MMKNETNTAELHTDEHIERYILGKMSKHESEEFEAYFLSNQACLDELEIAQKLHMGMQYLGNDSVFDDTKKSIIKSRIWDKKIPVWSLAAALILALVAPQLILIRSSIPVNNNIEVVGIELAESRGTLQDIPIVNSQAQQVLLSFYIDTDTPTFKHSSYLFVLINSEGQTVLKVPALKLNNVSTLFVNLGTADFDKGLYEVQIFGETDEEPLLLQSGTMQLK